MDNEKILEGAIKRAEQEVSKITKKKVTSIKHNNEYLFQDQKGVIYLKIIVDKNGYFTYSVEQPLLDSFLRINNLIINSDENIFFIKKFNRDFSNTISRLITSEEIFTPVSNQSNIGIVIDPYSIVSLHIDDFNIPVIENKQTVDKDVVALIIETTNSYKAVQIRPIIDRNIRSAIVIELFKLLKPKIDSNLDNINDLVNSMNLDELMSIMPTMPQMQMAGMGD